jgi:putative ABC transport system permease protein
MLESLVRDIRLAARSLLRAPLLTAIIVLTFALGIGGTATMFTAVNAAYLRALPYPAADRLVSLWQTYETRRQVPVSMLNVLDWQTQARSFAHLAAYNAGTVNVTSGAEPARSRAGFVTRDFFAALGVEPRLGRGFTAEETVKGGARSVVISDRLWRRVFRGDPAAVGKPLGIEGVPIDVVGVMPQGFQFPPGADLWMPLPTDDGSTRSAHNYRVVARMKPGVSLERARSDMETVAARLAQAYPEANDKYGVSVVPLRNDLLGRTGPVLLLLLGAVSFVLLIACANVTNLLFARSIARQAETTLRLALGATRTELVRPFLAESMLLALAGGLLGLGLAAAGSKLLAGLAPASVLDPKALHADGAVISFTFVVALAAGLLCCLAPALRSSRTDLRSSLSAGGRLLGGGGSRGMNALIVAEVAVAFVLLAGAGLLIRSARHLESVDPGFAPHNVALLGFTMGGLTGSPFNDEGWRSRFYSRLLDRVAVLPGVVAAGVVSQPPLSGGSYNGTLELADRPGEAPGRTEEAHYRLIGGSYFAALGIPVRQGRSFGREDRAGAPLTAIVNERLARRIAPDGNVLGREVRIPGMDGVEGWATVVGMVGDVRHYGLGREPVPEIYFPFEQRPGRTDEMAMVVHAQSGPAATAARVREEVRALDPGLPVELGTMSRLLDADLSPARFRAGLLGAFAAMALVLAAVGIFGVVSYAVGRRQREVAIRMALGADRQTVQSLVVRGGMKPVLLGIGIGFVLSLILMRVLAGLLSGLLFEVGIKDPVAFGVTLAVLGAAALAANYLPARRATRVDPMEVLRAE